MEKTIKATFTFLGTGSSLGVPIIGCNCPVCSSTNPLNKRLRPSGYIQIQDKKILLDVGPDFREQALKEKISQVDGILLTHPHFDHIAGIDELRVFNFIQKRPIPCLLSLNTLKELQNRYGYLFIPKKEKSFQYVDLSYTILKKSAGTINFLEIPIQYFSYKQAKMDVRGYRIGNLAYVTDIKEYEVKIIPYIQGIDILILSALRYEPSVMHFSIYEAIDFADKIGAKKVWFTHIAHELEHEKLQEWLPNNMQLAHDGLTFSFEVIL